MVHNSKLGARTYIEVQRSIDIWAIRSLCIVRKVRYYMRVLFSVYIPLVQNMVNVSTSLIASSNNPLKQQSERWLATRYTIFQTNFYHLNPAEGLDIYAHI